MEPQGDRKHGGLRLSGVRSLYLHIPFCVSKCPYCSFSSFSGWDHLYERYVHCLMRELELRYADRRGCHLKTLFIGGGTPTVLLTELLVKTVEHCRTLFGFAEGAEISTEANPGTVDLEMLKSLRECGVNRLSLGAQSFSADELTAIGRVYEPVDIYQAFENARKAGFENISLDLMYGLPGQTAKRWQANLEEAFMLGPEHLSLYQLSIDENTGFHELYHKGLLDLPAEDTIAEMDGITKDLCASEGFHRYEISNYSREGQECRHNLVYWRNEEYMACGAGAVSFLGGARVRNIENPGSYCTGVETGHELTVESETLDQNESFRETVMLGLRLIKGVSTRGLYRRFRRDLRAEYGKVLDDLLDQGFLELDSEYLKLTERGLQLANRVMAELI